MTFDECQENIGRAVVYEPYPGGPREDGKITEVRQGNRRSAFVLYRGDSDAKDTPPGCLTLLRVGS